MLNSMLNDIELTILSLVAEGPRYGAEIEQMIELRGLREWLTVGSASIYYILGRLEQQELLTSAQPPGETDSTQTAYQITDAGRGVAQTAITDLLCQPRTLGQGFELGLANSGALKPQQVYRALIQHRDRLTHQLQSTEALWERCQREETPSQGTQALYSHGIAIMQAELHWLTTYVEEWRARHPAVERDEAREMDDSTQTPLHRRTVSSEQEKQLQRIKRPKRE